MSVVYVTGVKRPSREGFPAGFDLADAVVEGESLREKPNWEERLAINEAIEITNAADVKSRT